MPLDTSHDYCAPCSTVVHDMNDGPDMGDTEFVWKPGTCDRCGARQTVFRLNP